MKAVLFAGAAFVLTAGVAVAEDEAVISPELTIACETINADNPALSADCACLAEKAEADETIMSELLAYEGMATLADSSVTAINECGASLEEGEEEIIEDVEAEAEEGAEEDVH